MRGIAIFISGWFVWTVGEAQCTQEELDQIASYIETETEALATQMEQEGLVLARQVGERELAQVDLMIDMLEVLRVVPDDEEIKQRWLDSLYNQRSELERDAYGR